jgi:hypothetical protein
MKDEYVPYRGSMNVKVRSPQTVGIIREVKERQRASITKSISEEMIKNRTRKSSPAVIKNEAEPILIQRSRRSGRISILTPDDAEVTITVEPPPKPKSRPPPILFDLEAPITRHQRVKTEPVIVKPPKPRTPAPKLDRAKYAVRISITSTSPIHEEDISNSSDDDDECNTEDRMSVSVAWSPMHDDDFITNTVQLNKVFEHEKKPNKIKHAWKKFVDKLKINNKSQ